jgi:hypothetical protein
MRGANDRGALRDLILQDIGNAEITELKPAVLGDEYVCA